MSATRPAAARGRLLPPARPGYNRRMQPDLAGNTVLDEFRRRAEAALPGRVARVVLYGSRARGDAGPDADWDVAVFLSRGPVGYDEQRALSDIRLDLLLETGAFIHARPFATGAEDDGSLLMRAVGREGRVVG